MTAPLLGLVGAKRAGKDSFADALVRRYGYRRLAFADALKRGALTLDPTLAPAYSWAPPVRLSWLVELRGWEGAKDDDLYGPEVRRILQGFGVAAREADPLVWVRGVLTTAQATRAPGYGSVGELVPGTPVVVTDVRFANEVAAIIDAGGLIVKIVRPGLVPDDPHPSEALAWDESLIPWLTIVNGGTLDDLHRDAYTVAEAAFRRVGGAWI